MDYGWVRQAETLALLNECKLALYEIKNTRLRATASKDTYELVKKIENFLEKKDVNVPPES